MKALVSRSAALACFCLTLAGCAGLNAAQCRESNWYDVAFRDAIFGLQPQEEFWAAQCGPHGVPVDGARYREGFTHGRYELQQRIVDPVE